MMKTRIAIACLLPLALGACAVGPDYVRPDVPVADQWQGSRDWTPASPGEVLAPDWWTLYGDARLDALVADARQANQTIAQSEAQYRQAAALLVQARSALFPTLSLTTSATRGEGTGNNSSGTISNSYNASLGASWQLDLWGAVRRADEAGDARLSSSRANLAAARLAVEVQLVTAYLQLRMQDRILGFYAASEADLQTLRALTLNRVAAGVASANDVALVDSQLQTLHAQHLDQQMQRSLLEHAIAVLTGRSPATFSLPAGPVALRVPAPPAGVPSTLLQRRPDIAAAERQVAQANAQIGISKAAWFPSLTLNASGGYKSSSFGEWITLPNRIWSIGPSIALSVFDAGLRRAQTDQAIAAYDQTVAAYRQTVLTAFQQVEDGLVSARTLADEARAQQAALEAAQRSERIASNQYEAGTGSKLGLINARLTRLAAERTAASTVSRQLVASVTLISSLGGGYQSE